MDKLKKIINNNIELVTSLIIGLVIIGPFIIMYLVYVDGNYFSLKNEEEQKIKEEKEREYESQMISYFFSNKFIIRTEDNSYKYYSYGEDKDINNLEVVDKLEGVINTKCRNDICVYNTEDKKAYLYLNGKDKFEEISQDMENCETIFDNFKDKNDVIKNCKYDNNNNIYVLFNNNNIEGTSIDNDNLFIVLNNYYFTKNSINYGVYYKYDLVSDKVLCRNDSCPHVIDRTSIVNDITADEEYIYVTLTERQQQYLLKYSNDSKLTLIERKEVE